MRFKLSGLWRDADFLKMWTGQTISIFGSQITVLALPLTAATMLKASPFQMGVLQAAEYLPFLLLGLFAGVWADRIRRRPILLWSNFFSALLLSFVPLFAFMGILRIEHLYVVVFLMGICTTFFQVANQSYLPSVVPRDKILEGNGKMEMSKSIAEVAGPGLAGVLVQALTGVGAVILNVISFIVSILFLRAIKKEEPKPEVIKTERRASVFVEIKQGLNLVFKKPVLRAIALSSFLSNFFFYMLQAEFVLYVTQRYGMNAATIGLIFMCAGLAAVLGTIVMEPLVRRFGQGPVIIVSHFVAGLSLLFIPFATGPYWMILALLIVGQIIRGFTMVIFNIVQISLRQSITPNKMQGRMNATMRSFVWGAIPIGSFVGGLLGESIGLQGTMIVASIGSCIAVVFEVFSPLRSKQEFKLDEDEEASVA